MKTKIPVKQFIDDVSLSWEERFKRLDAHHQEETTFLISRIEELEPHEPQKSAEPTPVHAFPVRYFTWITKVCDALGWDRKKGGDLLNNPSWRACYDDGLSPEDAAREYAKNLVGPQTFP